MKISEIFHSIQGEGKYSGRPSTFIRVAKCNLTCPSFGVNGCDSYYAVNDKYQNEWFDISLDEIQKEIDKNPKSDIVLTGGEPTLFYKELYPIIQNNQNKLITIETNSTIYIDFEKYPLYKNVAFAMSVKLSNSGESESKRIKPEVIKNISLNAKKSFFKFVINRDLNEEIKKITKDINMPIYCMPLGESEYELQKNSFFVFDFCLKNSYNYSDRIHIRIFDKKKGV